MDVEISKKESRELSNELTEKIQHLILNEPKLNDLSSKQIDELLKKHILNNLSSQLTKEIEKAKFNEDEIVSRWLNSFKSKYTQEQYELRFKEFRRWLSGSLLDVTSEIADEYSAYVIALGGSDSLHQSRVVSISSLYSKLVRWNYVNRNPFQGGVSIKVERLKKRADEIPMSEDIDRLKEYCILLQNTKGKKSGDNKKRLSGKRNLAIILILEYTGLRSGSLKTFQLFKNGDFIAKSKGGKVQGCLPEYIIEDLASLGYAGDINGKYLFKNYTGFKMFLRSAIRYTGLKNFSAHGFRHYFAVNHYKEHKDIVKLQRALGHSSSFITDTYLSSLNLK